MFGSPDHSNGSYTSADQGIDVPEDMWSDLKRVIIDVGHNLSPDSELGDLAAAESAVNAKDVERRGVLGKLESEVRELTRTHDQARTSAERPPHVPTEAEHRAQVRSLEQEQYSTGKSLSEAQSVAAKMDVELGRWRMQREEVRQLTVGEGEEEGFNAKAIRLNVLDGCGFRLLASEGATKVVIRNDAKTDINTITLDKSRSKVYYANLMWSLAGE